MRVVRKSVSGMAFTMGTLIAVPAAAAQTAGSATRGVRIDASSNAGPASTVDTSSLAARVDALDQQIRILERRRELAADSAADAAKSRQSATANAKDGFSIRSADGQYSLKLRGYAQADGRFFPSDDAGAIPNNFLLRRARPIVEVTVGQYFGFRIMPDFAGSQAQLLDAYWEGNFDPAFSVRAGKFKPPIGFERIQSATDITFAERGLPTNLAPSRDIGLQVAGEIGEGVLEYQAGIFNGAADLASADADLNDFKDIAARVFVRPIRDGALRGLGIGISGSTGIEQGNAAATDLASYRSTSQQTFFRYRTDAVAPENTVNAEGRRSRLSPHAYLGLGPFGVLGEYIVNRQEVRSGVTLGRLTHEAWQASGSFFLTGEYAGFRSPTPKKPFDLKAGTFGAVELAARYGELDVDDDAFPVFANPASSASKAKGLGLGVNWHLNRQIKVLVSYERTTFEGGAEAGDRDSEDFVVTRFQHAF
jgi:phosphate-selective porin OprO/OprP